jgi:putative sterol carrier protein
MTVPRSPADFFEHYVPARFEDHQQSLGPVSSSGSLSFSVFETVQYSFRIEGGRLVVEHGVAQDCILQLSVSHEDFQAVVVRAAEEQQRAIGSQVLAFKALLADAERIALIRKSSGTLDLAIRDAKTVHHVFVTPGSAAPNLEAPACAVHCELPDFLALQAGTQHPMQLVMSGRIRITGNAHLAMALSGVFL